MQVEKIRNPEVAAVFKAYPDNVRIKLMYLRRFILDTAASIECVGELEETLKWGEPSYLTLESKSGSTVRIDWKKSQENEYAVYFKCTANLVPAFKKRFPETFRYGGDRSILFYLDDEIPVNELKKCISMALTYHLNKKADPNERWEMVERFLNH